MSRTPSEVCKKWCVRFFTAATILIYKNLSRRGYQKIGVASESKAVKTKKNVRSWTSKKNFYEFKTYTFRKGR